MKKRILITALFCGLILAGCTENTQNISHNLEPQSAELFAMDTVMTLTAYGDNAQKGLSAAEKEIERLDKLFSVSSESGDILPINQNHSGKISKDTKELLTYALEIAKSTNGAFDCTVAPIMTAWGFTSGEYRVPAEDEIKKLLEKVDYKQVKLENDTVTLQNDAQLDLGGIAKGFTSSRVMEIFAENGIESGIISLGGNIQTLGSKPDGSFWRVGIQNPKNSDELFAVAEVKNEAVITSGGYERYFEQDGMKYHHIINPYTGYPSNSGLCSVTIISENGTLADGLSTAIFVMGTEKAIDYWHNHSEEFDMVLMDDDENVYITKGLEGRFDLQNNSTLTIIS